MRRDKIIIKYADFLLLVTERHDAQFRLKHQCNCKSKIDYGSGDWYCEAMLNSRRRDKEIKKIKTAAFQEIALSFGEDFCYPPLQNLVLSH